MIIVTSLHRDFLPSSWGMFDPTFWDWAIAGRLDRRVRLAVPDVRALPAGDLDLRDAQAGARRSEEERDAMSARDAPSTD